MHCVSFCKPYELVQWDLKPNSQKRVHVYTQKKGTKPWWKLNKNLTHYKCILIPEFNHKHGM